MRGNSKVAKQIADDKLATKQLMLEHGLGAANLIAVLRNRQDIKDLDWDALPPSFVIKPNRGFGGEGIVVIFRRLSTGRWLSTNKREYSNEDLSNQMYDILDGNFSLHETPDIVLIEQRLAIDPSYKRFAAFGLPDIRVIVYNGVPVMAMIRVPTKKSGGKANLAQGGIAVGIDIATGFTTHAVQKSWMFEKEIDVHPDTGARLRGVRLPYWEKILRTAIGCANIVGLRYCGVDISVDKKIGPVVLELNARPGLGIQLANVAPLRERLDRITGLKIKGVEHGLAIAQELFADDYAEEVQQMTGRPVIGPVEEAILTGLDDVKKTVLAKIDTGASSSSIDEELARSLGYGEAIDQFTALIQTVPTNLTMQTARHWIKEHERALLEQQPLITRLTAVQSSHGISVRMQVKLSLTLAGRTVTIEPNIYPRTDLTYPMLIGERNLSPFLIDVTKLSAPKRTVKKSTL